MIVCPLFTVSPTFTLISRMTPGSGDLTPDLPVDAAAGFATGAVGAETGAEAAGAAGRATGFGVAFLITFSISTLYGVPLLQRERYCLQCHRL